MYLIDTHVLLWFLLDDKKLSSKAKNIIKNPDNHIYVSIASIWEIAIKQSIGKLSVDKTPVELIELALSQKIGIIEILGAHLNQLSSLEKIHNDPFDRLIISQAKAEGFKLLTKDEIIPKYDVEVIW